MAKRESSQVAGTLTVGGVAYVVIPRAEYVRLSAKPKNDVGVDAEEFVRELIADSVRAAREHAGLTQAELAQRMNKSQTLVSQAEVGNAKVSERYVRAVLKACGLPEDWSPPKKRGKAKARAGARHA